MVARRSCATCSHWLEHIDMEGPHEERIGQCRVGGLGYWTTPTHSCNEWEPYQEDREDYSDEDFIEDLPKNGGRGD